MNGRKSLTCDFKKSQLGMEIIPIMIVVLLVAIISLVAYNTLTNVNADIQNQTDMSSDSKAVTQDLQDRFPKTFDSAVVLIIGLLFILLIVAGFMADAHPIFLVAMIFIMIFVLLGAMIMSNVWDEFTSDNSISFEDDFPMTDFLLDNFLVVIMAMAFTVMIAIFVKKRVTE